MAALAERIRREKKSRGEFPGRTAIAVVISKEKLGFGMEHAATLASCSVPRQPQRSYGFGDLCELADVSLSRPTDNNE